MSHLITEILEWAEDNPDFDTSFVKSVSAWCCDRDMTDRQAQALQNIYDRFGIGKGRTMLRRAVDQSAIARQRAYAQLLLELDEMGEPPSDEDDRQALAEYKEHCADVDQAIAKVKELRRAEGKGW
jgi:hypothetical protein